MPSSEVLAGRTLVEGRASGEVVRLDQPLNVWSGLDTETGQVSDPGHQQVGRSVAGRVLVTPSTRGSGTNAQVLAEAIRAGNGPAAVVLRTDDLVLCAGIVVGREMYGHECPVVVVLDDDFAKITDGATVEVVADEAQVGRVVIS